MTTVNPRTASDSTVPILETRRRIRRVAELLDSGIGVPGTRLRIGIEALIGLIPVVGDLTGLILGGYFLYEGVRLRVPAVLLARMIGNVLFDALIGLVPVAGDLADFTFKSNQRNARLLDAHIDRALGVVPAPSPWPLRVAIGLAAGAAAAAAYALWRVLGAG